MDDGEDVEFSAETDPRNGKGVQDGPLERVVATIVEKIHGISLAIAVVRYRHSYIAYS